MSANISIYFHEVYWTLRIKITSFHNKIDLNDTDNYSGMITHLEPDILESKVKWDLGSITTNKASEGDGIPVELFQMLKADAMKVLHSYFFQEILAQIVRLEINKELYCQQSNLYN